MKTNFEIDKVYLTNLNEKEAIKKAVNDYIQQNNLFASFSDNHEFFCYVISDQEIGLDFQKIENVNYQDIVNYHFFENEKKFVDSLVKFHFLWSRKEALFKAINDKKSTIFSFSAIDYEQRINNKKYYLYTKPIQDKKDNGYLISIASTKKDNNFQFAIDSSLLISK